MSKQSISDNQQTPFVVAHPALAVSLLASVLIVSFSALWWSKVHDSPRRVFNGMLSNNLSTPSVTRETFAGENNSVDKLEELSFTPPLASRSLVSISETSQQGTSKVVSETIGTLTQDFSRYVSISTSQMNKAGKLLDYRSVENIWGKSDITSGPPQYYNQSILGLVPFGNLDTLSRHNILKMMEDDKVYTVDYSKVKPLRLDGKSALVFPVKVATVKYIALLKAVAKSNGSGDLSSLNPDDYKNQPSIDIVITVDKRSRQILEVTYGQQKELYSSYGLTSKIEIPNKTIPVEDLQSKVKAVQ